MDLIKLSDAAIAELKKRLSKRLTPASYVRLGVKGGACNGFEYAIQYVAEVRDRDTVFVFDEGSLSVVIDPKSLEMLKGISVDYKRSLIEEGFVFSNPNAKSTCGCGRSFGT